MLRILIVEDEPKVAAFIKLGLEENDFTVKIAEDGEEGKKLALNHIFDLIILDVNLPKINGIDLCKIIRDNDIKTPVLMLTALGSTDDKVSGFESGSDDYLVKPFEFRELLVRVKALIKRATPTNAGTILRIEDLELNAESKVVKRGNKKIDLTAKEFALLEYLMKHKDRVVSRKEIADKVWDIHFDTGTNVIDVYVNFLRKKIDKDFDRKIIQTQVGMGYVIRENS
jgi:two-component system, OmpR family, copper resistance phosphate regulon response regulator CusR